VRESLLTLLAPVLFLGLEFMASGMKREGLKEGGRDEGTEEQRGSEREGDPPHLRYLHVLLRCLHVLLPPLLRVCVHFRTIYMLSRHTAPLKITLLGVSGGWVSWRGEDYWGVWGEEEGGQCERETEACVVGGVVCQRQVPEERMWDGVR